MRIPATLLLSIALLYSCKAASSATDGQAIKDHIRKLASDEFEGRAPGGKGEELTTTYIADFYKSIGLKTQFQEVPMAGITSIVSALKLTGKNRTTTLKYGDDFMAWSMQERDAMPTNADLVFCGYGVTAPEY